ncbi:glycosyltransferase family 4 protein [Pyxidicoccus parkwayensis]|uniref:Glycosyltransferase family 4 protein n=1 Tax=Pyxidicoccus parkwayensis TaxID=2813578 RepID=A0ABX7NMX1_9BACT|nr:glycosyltransferase family 4 protein [Pyxidicoccus parkwaysis]QSQ20207.1 glycosyltransferase family 4 protein [Pyxidicoccus parkwaysis]
MRVLLGIHHPLDANLGAPGVTLALGRALAALGCEVDYYSYQEAFPGVPWYGSWHGVRFPWKLAAHLAREAHRYDVLDITTGDAWAWARLGRPGARARHALVTRSHGLEHVVSEQLHADAREGRATLSWKYPLYHGGFRLWEVRQSLLLADHAVLLNARDAAYSRERLGVPASKLSVIPHGLDEVFLGLPPPRRVADSVSERAPLRVAFVGSWIQRKGREEVVAVARELTARGVPFRLSLYGTGLGVDEVLGSFPAAARERLTVVPRYVHTELPRLLADDEVLLFPSHSEGFGMALVEAMACGLAPVSSPVGVAPQVVRHGQTGCLIPVGDVSGLVGALCGFADQREQLQALRQAAQHEVRNLTWRDIGARTLSLYETLLGNQRKP